MFSKYAFFFHISYNIFSKFRNKGADFYDSLNIAKVFYFPYSIKRTLRLNEGGRVLDKNHRGWESKSGNRVLKTHTVR